MTVFLVQDNTPEFLQFLGSCQKMCWKSSSQIQVYAIIGNKYAKVVRSLSGKLTALCFLDLTDGTVYRAAKWESPYLKFQRGNIFSENNGMGELTADGTRPLHNGKPKGYKHELVYPRGENKGLGPHPRLPKELIQRKPHPKHHAGLIRNRKEPLVAIPAAQPAIALVRRTALPIRIFTPKTHTED